MLLPPRRHPRRPRVPSKGTRAPRQRRMRNLRPTDPARGGGCTIWCRRDLSPRRAAPHPPTNRLWWGGGPPQFRVRPRGGQLEISVPRDPTAPRQLGPRRRHASGAARRSCVDPGGPPAGPTRPQAPPPRQHVRRGHLPHRRRSVRIAAGDALGPPRNHGSHIPSSHPPRLCARPPPFATDIKSNRVPDSAGVVSVLSSPPSSYRCESLYLP